MIFVSLQAKMYSSVKKYCVLFLLVVINILTGCDYLVRKHQVGAIAELNGQYLHRSEIDPLVAGLDSVDSARVVDAYIRRWATDILVYDAASHVVDKSIEALVEDYRRSLYVHAYEERLVSQRMSHLVSDDAVLSFYEDHKSSFVLREAIVQGLLLVVPKDAPKLDKLRSTLSKKEESLEEIENYAYQYATGYELFTEKWRRADELIIAMPFAQNDLMQQLRNKSQIELSDSVSTYILQITDKHFPGELMPLEYARPEIEKVILSQRQVSFLQKERDALYEKKYKQQKR